MADYKSHISFSFLIALVYAAIGPVLLYLEPDIAVLAGALIIIAGMLPNIDAGGGAPAREVGGVLAAVSPLAFFEFFPGLRAGGMVHLALVVIASYLLTRFFISRFLNKHTVRRGMFHSVPAAILTFEATYLLFFDLQPFERTYLGTAAFVGFLSHLFLDAWGNLDLLGKAMGNGGKKSPVLKFWGPSTGASVVMYAGVLLLGWFVVKDLYPAAKIVAPVEF